ncbi:extracellular solute-binding protein family 1 [Candidatus Vecturithrix granuli]|uniref:Extracellular solute-binding protein family 1 n=1 Tax=Vecturithrix granuli TaxID=1499967 RepID=A0A081BZ32_VECG1|nr:extracellular solute-binding protein family 1 [Candidatus Vecturithrix granuli]
MKRIMTLLVLVLVFLPLYALHAEDPVEIVIYNNSGAMSAAQGGAASDPKHVEFIHDYILKRTGVSVKVIPPVIGNEEEKLNAMLAGGVQVDAFWGNWDKYYGKGVIIPLNDLMPKYGPSILPKWPQESIKAMTDKDGNLWGIPRVTPTIATNPWVRTDWAEKLGVKFPETIDELETYLEACSQNKDKLAGDDTIILLAEIQGKHNSQGIFQTFVGGFTEYGFSNWPDEGKIKPYFLQEGYLDFLTTMNRWYSKGYMYPEFASLSREKVRELVKTGHVAATATWYSNVANVHWDMNQVAPEANFEMIPLGIEGPKGKAETVRPATTQGMMISAQSKHPEAVVKVMELLYSSPEAYATSSKGPEGVNWEWTDKEKGLFKLLTEQLNYVREFDFAVGLPVQATAGVDNAMFLKENEVWGLAGKGKRPPMGLDFSRGKMPYDAGVIYDVNELAEKIPTYNDLVRVIEEEQIKFITGDRPLSEWNDFLQELNDLDLATWIDVHTEIYNRNQ